MDKNILKNSWFVAGIMLLINILFGLALSFTEIGSSIALVITFVTAMTIGMFYTKNFNEIMPKKQRLKIAVIYAVFSLILSIYLIYQLISEDKTLMTIIIISSIIGFVLSIAIIYYALGKGGKIYLKSKNAAHRNSS